MVKQRKQKDLNFLNACDHLNWIILERKPERLPAHTCRQVVVAETEHEHDREHKNALDDIIEKIKSEGLMFAWLQLNKNEPPHCLIDMQDCRAAEIVTPPFIFVTTPKLSGLVTLRGSYVTYTTRDGHIEQAWTLKHKLRVNKKNILYYKSKKINIPDMYPDETKH